MSQTLRTKLQETLKDGRFGASITGSDWCIKALHPSDPLTEVRGIPDHSSVPTLCMNYQSTFTLTIADEQEGPWDFNLTMLPHPYYFAFWEGSKAYNPEGDISGEGNFWNTQLVSISGEPTAAQLYTAWNGLASRWRMAYAGLTVYQDGPDLANQGTIVVAQAPLTSRRFNPAALVNNEGWVGTIPIAFYDQATQGPNFARSQTMPNAMMGRSRDGAYVPLKLTDTNQDWYSTENDVGMLASINAGTGSVSSSLPGTGSTPGFPFVRATPANIVTQTSPASAILGDAVSALSGTNCAHVCARNLSDQTSYTFYFRFGVEMQLNANSSLTPQLKLSPPYDPVALDTYFMLSREMKDAYPADYNDLGKMWDVISGAAKTIAPMLNGLFPGLGPATRVVTGMGDAIRARRKPKQITRAEQMEQYEIAPAATVERAQKEKIAREIRTPAAGVRLTPKRSFPTGRQLAVRKNMRR